MAAAALYTGDRMQVWAGNQLPTQFRNLGAQLTGLPEATIQVETMLVGGGFGSRTEMDVIALAITRALAQKDPPILIAWTREEGMTHDFYRPAALARVRVKPEGGRSAGFYLSRAYSSVVASQLGRLGYNVPRSDASIVQGAVDQPYAFANYRVTGYRARKAFR